MLKLLMIIWLLCFNTLCVCCQIRDSIFLINGQVLIGEIKGVQFGELTLDEIDLKMVTVKLYKIKFLKTRQEYKIETNTRKTYYGSLQQSDNSNLLNIITKDNAIIPVNKYSIYFITPLRKNLFSGLSGTLSAGGSYSKSSSAGQINLSTSATYRSKLFEYYFNAAENASIDSSTIARNNENLSFLMGYDIAPTWMIIAGANYQRNLELSVARRFQEIAGAGNKVLLRKYCQLMLISGISANQEKSTGGATSGWLYEVPLMMRFNFFKYHHPNIQISSVQSVYYSLSQKNRIRFEGNTSFSWELVRYFYIAISPYSHYDNQPPDGGSNFDYGVVVSLSYKF